MYDELDNNTVLVTGASGLIGSYIVNSILMYDKKFKEMLVEKFSSNLIRFYYGQDMIGSEIGAASKNVEWPEGTSNVLLFDWLKNSLSVLRVQR